MPESPEQFFQAGGTMAPRHPAYVPRRADAELVGALRSGEFCYVLTTRQMGKSSLMVRAATALREAGAGVVVLDLTSFGRNLTAEQWYGDMARRVGQQLGLREEVLSAWRSDPSAGPMQRWAAAIVEVALPRFSGGLVIFVDEIDAVRSLPFSADEFFAAVRSFYNRRAEEPELRRLSWCLIGVATPTDLIRDPRLTPFNIGRRIELGDISRDEAAPLAAGLPGPPPRADALLRRILHWTDGHPYLTQRLCLVVAGEPGASPRDVDRLVAGIYFSNRGRQTDDNLLFVQNRIVHGSADLAGLLDLYRRVLSGKPVPGNRAGPAGDALKLSGVVKEVDGRLRVRNRIYRDVFGRRWVVATTPDAERRRERAAVRRAVLRIASVTVPVVLLLLGLILFGRREQRHATEAEAEALRRLHENEKLQGTKSQLYREIYGYRDIIDHLTHQITEQRAAREAEVREADEAKRAAAKAREDVESSRGRADKLEAEAGALARTAAEAGRKALDAQELAEDQRRILERTRAAAAAAGRELKARNDELAQIKEQRGRLFNELAAFATQVRINFQDRLGLVGLLPGSALPEVPRIHAQMMKLADLILDNQQSTAELGIDVADDIDFLYAVSLALARRYREGGGDRAEGLRMLAASYEKLGDRSALRARHGEALSRYRQSLETASELAGVTARSPEDRVQSERLAGKLARIHLLEKVAGGASHE